MIISADGHVVVRKDNVEAVRIRLNSTGDLYYLVIHTKDNTYEVGMYTDKEIANKKVEEIIENLVEKGVYKL